MTDETAETAANSSKVASEQLAFGLTPRVVPDLTDRIWASGFFDGEGCVNLTRDRSGNVRAQVVITNTDLTILEWLRVRWGGQIYTHKPGTQRQPAFQWRLSEPVIPAFLDDIRPHMRIKVAQTDNCLAFLRLKQQRRRHSHFSEVERLAYEAFLANHKALNLTHGGQEPHSQHIIRNAEDPRRSRRVG
jgi:hypothetical protein